MTYRDRDAYEALLALLRGSGEFARVALGLDSDPGAEATAPAPSALVVPDGWAEAPDSGPGSPLRTVAFRLILTVVHPDPHRRFLAADRLAAVAQNLIDGSDLGGTCLAGLTKLTRCRFPARPGHPAFRAVLDGTFAYCIPAPAARDTTA